VVSAERRPAESASAPPADASASRRAVPKTAAASTPGAEAAAALDPAVRARAERFEALGVAPASALLLAADEAMAALFEQAAARAAPPAVAKWMVNDLRALLAERPVDVLDGARLAELVAMVESGTITATIGKEVLARMVETGEPPATIVTALGARRLGARDELAPLVAAVLDRHPDEVSRYRAGKRQLLGFLLGQVMRASEGRASPALARALLTERLDSP
jgi:Asp-tRNA(Asn)/Glu-tRNA(Gln) amidotransferase B subunit